MRHAIETAPKDGKLVILEEDATGAFDVAYWSPEAGQWVGKNSEPSPIRPTHWQPLARDQYLLREDEGSSEAGPSAWLGHYSAYVGIIAAAALVFFYLTRDAGRLDIAKISEQVVAQAPQLPSQVSKTALPAPRQIDANQASAPAEAQQVAQLQQTAVASVMEARRYVNGERAEALAQERTEARRASERLDVPLRATAKSEQSLGQEGEKTAVLEREAAAPRQELMELITRTEIYRQALYEERARRTALASELATAKREIETQAAQLRKASDGTRQLKQAEAAKTSQSFEQERQKTAALAQEAAAAREELIASAAQHRQALDEERVRSAALASELATAQREIEAQAAQLRKASDEIEQLRRTEGAKNAQSLEHEREQTAALAQEAAAAREEPTASSAQHRQALDEERTRSAALASELAVAQREIEAQVARLRKASDETAELKQAESAKSAQSLEQEREQTGALTLAAAAARQELTATAAQHRYALDEELARSAALASEVAVAQREIETQAVQLRKASDEIGELRQATESAMAELRQSLQQERDRTAAMARDLESAQHVVGVGVPPEPATSSQISKAQAVAVVAMAKPAAAEAQSSPEATRLIARASALLSQGDIGAARIVLERAAETGSARASFMLAETYDPTVLSAWGTYGTRGEVTRARELYAKAHAGGIQEAEDRINALRQ